LCVNNINRHTLFILNNITNIWHSCLNNVHNIDVQITQIDEWHLYLFHTNLWKTDFVFKDFWKIISWLVLKLEISYYRVIIYWRILVFFSRGFFFEDCILTWWKILALKILLNCKWQGHHVSHTPCYITLLILGWFFENFQKSKNLQFWGFHSEYNFNRSSRVYSL
jgi:hypothetical protein